MGQREREDSKDSGDRPAEEGRWAGLSERSVGEGPMKHKNASHLRGLEKHLH